MDLSCFVCKKPLDLENQNCSGCNKQPYLCTCGGFPEQKNFTMDPNVDDYRDTKQI